MADNEILYNFEIDEKTVWSSHTNDKKVLISQRFYLIDPDDNNYFICYCDIPCYPTGLFLHLKIHGPKTFVAHSGDIEDYTYYLDENMLINFFPYTGTVKLYDAADHDITDLCIIEACWGTCVPKTYCANGETIFGYHDFKSQTAEEDLAAKWYYCKNNQIFWYKFGSFRKTSISATLTPGSNTTSAMVFLPDYITKTDIDSVQVPNVSSQYVKYDGYQYFENGHYISLKFRSTSSENNSNFISFTFSVKIVTEESIDDLQNIKQLIFMDPNLWCFTTRTVNENQTPEDVVHYPMYKTTDNNGNHQAIYLLNTTDLDGTYDFLSTPGKGYIFQDGNKTYESFTYGYMSNMPEDNKWPVNDAAVGPLLTSDNNNLSYYNNTTPSFNASLVSRYGIKGTATRAMIKDSPFAQDQNNTKWLMEGKDEETNLLYQKTKYSLSNPLLLYTSDDKQLKRLPKYSALIDQFHLLIEDVVYRVPLNWHVQLVKKKSIIKSIKTDWYYQYRTDSTISGMYSSYFYMTYSLNSNQKQLIIDSEATIDEFSLKESEKESSMRYFNLRKNTWKYQLTTDIQSVHSCQWSSWPSSDKYIKTISWNLETLNIFFNDFVVAFQNRLLNGTSPFNIEHHDLKKTYSIGKTQTSKTLIPNNNASISSSKQSFDNRTDAFFLFYIGLGIRKPGYRLNLNQEINSVPSDPEMDSYGEKIMITNNTLQYTKPGTTTRTIETTETFESSQNKEIIPADSWGAAPFNGIPLISYQSDSNSTNLDDWDGNNWFFNFNVIDPPYGESIGLDAFAQFFDYDQYPEESIFIYTWSDKKIKILTKTFESKEYSSVGNGTKILYEQDTGFTVDDPVYDLTASTDSNWPQFQGSVELIDNKHVIKGNLVFYGGGPSSGKATITLNYITYE